MTDQTRKPRSRLRTAFYAFGWFAIALQAYNFFLFLAMILK